MAQVGVLASLLAPVVVRGADAGANYLIDNQPAIVAELKSIEGDAVTFLENELLGAIPKQSLAEKFAAGDESAFVRNLATELAGQLDGDDNALLNAIEAMLEKVSSALST